MSDWGSPPEPNPTICIDFLWESEPTAWCCNCSQQVNVDARAHWEGCGIVYQFVTTRAFQSRWHMRVRVKRPDLKFVPSYERLPEHKVEFLKERPLQPMFAWERGVPTGEGQAGEHVRYLRSRRRPTRAYPVVQTKEILMPDITVTITAESIEDLVGVLLDLTAYEGVGVRVYDRPKVAQEETVTFHRARFTGSHIRPYLEKVCARNDTLPKDQRIEVALRYTSLAKEASERTVIPVRCYNNKLILRDLSDDGAIKTFRVEGIEWVEGPNL